ncbi:ribosome small subunit-dependent GTPase A [Clostridium sp. DJ247]|uniref:ribosome small subunit-dependent GTPase A n=1 Tax=Clostridium sp. DJ247 TaxID=2726188 RepID=UPI00162321D0|nr:ribosome small subunit-dependent GTPase A [Clostridium sp. DJ247]MBC2581664.1 ribosome small subunit-dependent GTPase A [Clostridium sp. DJ247]
MNYTNLKNYGLIPRFEQEATLYDGMFLARVSEQHRDLYKVIGESGEMHAVVSGKLAYTASDRTDFPVVGDWVMVDRTDDSAGNAVIHHVLRRKSMFERKAAGTSNTIQIVAANIDIVFICMSLNSDFNLRRLERYLSIAWDSMATPVIILTKSDLCNDLDLRLAEISTVSVGTDVVICSSMEETGYKDVLSYITEGKTIAFIGSSGVGKSTLINRLMGRDILATKKIRQDDKGRHTTTHRQLLLLPGGGIVIDTPGMRELQLDSGNLSKSFEDIEDLSAKCKYRDCSHSIEPGCAVRSAIEAGELSKDRFENYKKLQKEISYEGLNSRQLEKEKIKRMFGNMGEMKQAMKYVKNKNKNKR